MKPAQVLTPARLAETREAMGLSRAQLADLMGVSYLSVRLWEQPGATITRLQELAFITVVQQLLDEKNEREAAGGKDA